MSSIAKLSNQFQVGFAEPREKAAKIAILDDFDGDPAGFPHGQAVESVLLSHSNLKPEDVQRVQNDALPADMSELTKTLPLRSALQKATVQNLSRFYLATAMNLKTILTEQPEVQVISQSQGETIARQVEWVSNKLYDDPGFRPDVIRGLSLPENSSDADIMNEVMIAARDAASSDPNVAKARKIHEAMSKEVHDQGKQYLVAAGNHGAYSRELQRQGVEIESFPGVFRNIFVNEYTTVVGANNATGSPSALNSPYSGIEVYARGEDLPWSAGDPFNQSGVASGTSFATPVVAAQVLEMKAADPTLSPFQIEARLAGIDAYQVKAGEQVSTANGQQLVGDGKLESYIQDQIGPGFLTDVSSGDVQQLATASNPSQFFSLPGEKDHEFQLIRTNLNASGDRRLQIDTYFKEGHHVMQALASGTSWVPSSVTEQLHLDPARQKEIEAREQAAANS